MVSPFAGQFLTEEVLPLRALRPAGRRVNAASRQGAVASRDAERIDLHPEGHTPGGGRDDLIHGTISGREGCSRRSDPGWIRTSDLRDVNAASTPDCSTGSVPVGPAGVEPASHRLSGGGLAARSTARFVQLGRRESNPVYLVQSQAGFRYNTPQIVRLVGKGWSRRGRHPRKQDSVLCHHLSNAPTRPSSPCSPAPVYLACTLRGGNDTGPFGRSLPR